MTDPTPDPQPTPDDPNPEPVLLPARPETRMLVVAAATLLGWMGAIGLAAGQTPDDNHHAAPTDPCQVEPEDRSEGTGRNGADDGQDEAGDGHRPSLENCDGVLTPPPTSDREIEQPPPDTGTTPVIPPGTVPEQPPD